ncbi:PDZ domain-containing protein [Streptomyces fagopyri]|uniref:PDZ domain-containing protein n=1 Tax=Streptomyces fagopyri TaxID=2662397 RepID=A0A5Q0LAW5_9ACTN|nr:PDZ domain-containing protein [Streptomyces fagopyri]QFZ73687.1 PDZ domain-containing protein [Streptomyces fagopyri]
MEQTALRPKPMPGQEPDGDGRPAPAVRRPHAVRRRGRRLMSLLFGLFVGTVLVLSGVGLGTVGATVIGMSRLADLQKQAGDAGAGQEQQGQDHGRGPGHARGRSPGPAAGAESGSPRSAPTRGGAEALTTATLGVEAVDASGGAGALLTGVHDPGPGHTAGLVRGDVLDAFDGTRVGSAADLARAVAAAHPGSTVTLGVRHADGGRQRLTAVPGIVT